GTDSLHRGVIGDTLEFTTPYTPGKYQVSTFVNIEEPNGLYTDNAGYLYESDVNVKVRKIDSTGYFYTLAGTDAIPTDVVTDSAGNVYVSEVSYKILKI